LKPNAYLEECAESLAAASQNNTDLLMPYFVHMQRLSEDVNLAFDYDSNCQLSHLDGVHVQILIKGFQRRFQQMEDTFPREAWCNCKKSSHSYKPSNY
jgi:chloramphenicol O-acetyltransferase